MYTLSQLNRLRWAVRAVLVLGIAASVAANILHAEPNPISRTISAWPPLALLLTVELTSRIPVHRPLLAVVRIGATASIAGVAAWISYWHMVATAARYGEASSSYLLPITVDGLIVVASVSLVELAGRIASLQTPAAGVTPIMVTEQVQAAPTPAPVAVLPATVEFVPPAPAPLQGVTVVETRKARPTGRSGPQVTGPSRNGLNGKPLVQAPPQA